MIRALLFVAFAVVAFAAAWIAVDRTPRIALHDAVATPMTGRANAWTVALTIDNDGPPDRLLGVRSEGAAMLVNPSAPGLAVIVPGDDSAQLAMDGAHAMLISDEGAGALVPLTLLFDRAGGIATSLRLTDAPAMDHGMRAGIEGAPAPTVSVAVTQTTGSDGFTVALDVANLALRQVEDGTPHIPGEGHAHVYLNGLKLGRAHAATMGVGRLPAGAYRLTVALNTHDHRPYLSDGAPVVDMIEFTVP